MRQGGEEHGLTFGAIVALVCLCSVMFLLVACPMAKPSWDRAVRQVDEEKARRKAWPGVCRSKGGRVVQTGKGGLDLCVTPDGRIVATYG